MFPDVAGRVPMGVRRVRHWSLASSALGPLGLLAAALAAHHLIAGKVPYSAIRDTMSVLASIPQTAAITTAGFVWCALCQIVTATGLPVRRLSRIVLGVAGVCGLIVATFPVEINAFPGMTAIHLAAAGTGATLLALWPVLSASRSPDTPLPFRLPVASVVTVGLLALLCWLLAQAVNGSVLGLAERMCIFGVSSWPAVATWWSYRHYHRIGRPIQPPDLSVLG